MHSNGDIIPINTQLTLSVVKLSLKFILNAHTDTLGLFVFSVKLPDQDINSLFLIS